MSKEKRQTAIDNVLNEIQQITKLNPKLGKEIEKAIALATIEALIDKFDYNHDDKRKINTAKLWDNK